jgi:hypothetical protein
VDFLQFLVLKTPLFCDVFAHVVLDETGSKEDVSHQEIDHAAGYNAALNSGEPIVLLVEVQPGTSRLRIVSRVKHGEPIEMWDIKQT